MRLKTSAKQRPFCLGLNVLTENCVHFNSNFTEVLFYHGKCPIDNMSALVKVLAWCLTGDKPLNKPILMNMNAIIWNHKATIHHLSPMAKRSKNNYCHSTVCGTTSMTYTINSLRPSDAYMHQCHIPTLLQMMACCLAGAKPFSEPMLGYCQLDLKNIVQLNLIRNSKVFIQGNVLEYLRTGGHFVSASMC